MREGDNLETLLEQAMLSPDVFMDNSFVQHVFSTAATYQQSLRERVGALPCAPWEILLDLKEELDGVRDYHRVVGCTDNETEQMSETLSEWVQLYKQKAREGQEQLLYHGHALLRSLDSRALGVSDSQDAESTTYLSGVIERYGPYLCKEQRQRLQLIQEQLEYLGQEPTDQKLAEGFAEVARELSRLGEPPVPVYRGPGASLIRSQPAARYLADSFIHMLRIHDPEADVVVTQRQSHEMFLWSASQNASSRECNYFTQKGLALLHPGGGARMRSGDAPAYSCAHIWLDVESDPEI